MQSQSIPCAIQQTLVANLKTAEARAQASHTHPSELVDAAYRDVRQARSELDEHRQQCPHCRA